MSHEKYQHCIDECLKCAVICNHCTIECLKETNVQELSRCIQLNLECAAICRSAAEIMSLVGEHAHHICQVCADICDSCAAECEKHADHHSHCKECAEVCRNCAEECRTMAGAMA